MFGLFLVLLCMSSQSVLMVLHTTLEELTVKTLAAFHLSVRDSLRRLNRLFSNVIGNACAFS